MASFDTSRTTYGATSVAGRSTGFVHAILAKAVSWNEARVTRNALSALTNRELEDIGLSRGDIEAIARQG